MKNLIQILIILIVAIHFVACENEIEFNGDEKASMMVINGFIVPDSVIKVHLSKSTFFLKDDSNFENITDATVQLWVNDVLKGNLTNLGKGYYSYNYFPKEGDKIKISASSGVFTNVFAITEIPKTVPILSYDTLSVEQNNQYIISYSSYSSGGGYSYTIDTIGVYHSVRFNIKMQFKDSAGIENFYLVGTRIRRTFEDSTTQIINFNINSDDMVFGTNSEQQDLIDASGSNYFTEFNDELIEGQVYKLAMYNFITSVEYKPGFEPDTHPGGVDQKKVIKNEILLDLASISKSYYLYLKSRDASYNVMELFSEPVQIYSNVQGGIGILGGYSVSTKSIELPKSYNLDYYSSYYGY